jgi:gas vesicle protein
MEMEKYESSSSAVTALVAFLAGAAAGAGLALVLAPRSGEEVRGKIRDMAADAMDKTKEYARNVGDKAKGVMEKGKEMAKDNPAMNAAVEKGQEMMQKAEERTNLS